MTSAESLANLIPKITGEVRSQGLRDPVLQRLYARLYETFRRRRSLLLFYLQHQVKLDELPWVAALENLRTTRDETLEPLTALVRLVLESYPQTILPNRFLRELRALFEAAGQKIRLVDEVAADIFMGTFSQKYLAAAKVAAKLLSGSLYERYYRLDYAAVAAIDDVKASRYGPATSEAFAHLCYRLAGETPGHWSSVAANGKVIEQEQILTTHNLAELVTRLELNLDAPALAQRTFDWIVRVRQRKFPCWRARLKMEKNTAYAWRQMVFFLAISPHQEVLEFLNRARETGCLANQVQALARAWSGKPFAGPLLGWSTG